MKTNLLLILVILLAGCHKEFVREEDVTEQPGLTTENFDVAYVLNEVNQLSEAIEDNIDLFSATESSSSITTKAKPVCPAISVQTTSESFYPLTVTIDFQDGCKGKRDNDISGLLYIALSSAWDTEGATHTVTFDRFEIDGVAISGTQSMTYDGVNSGVYTFTVTSDLTFTWADGYWINRKMTKTRSYIAGFNTPSDATDNIIQISGTITDLTSEGETYTITTTTPLTANLDCSYFTSGILNVSQNSELAFTLDYGDGTCDNKATISKGDYSQDITLTKTRNVNAN